MYAKLENGVLRRAPNKITLDGMNIWNASGGQYLRAGYKLVVYTTPGDPPDGYYYAPSWEESETEITQVWTLEEIPPDADIDDTEALGIILGM